SDRRGHWPAVAMNQRPGDFVHREADAESSASSPPSGQSDHPAPFPQDREIDLLHGKAAEGAELHTRKRSLVCLANKLHIRKPEELRVEQVRGENNPRRDFRNYVPFSRGPTIG